VWLSRARVGDGNVGSGRLQVYLSPGVSTLKAWAQTFQLVIDKGW